MPTENKKPNAADKNTSNLQKEQLKEIKKATESYVGKSEAELLSELNSKLSKGKEKGTITDKQLQNFEKKVGPMLDEQQRKKLKKIMESINKK